LRVYSCNRVKVKVFQFSFRFPEGKSIVKGSKIKELPLKRSLILCSNDFVFSSQVIQKNAFVLHIQKLGEPQMLHRRGIEKELFKNAQECGLTLIVE
jgi:hypothetical protein